MSAPSISSPAINRYMTDWETPHDGFSDLDGVDEDITRYYSASEAMTLVGGETVVRAADSRWVDIHPDNATDIPVEYLLEADEELTRALISTEPIIGEVDEHTMAAVGALFVTRTELTRRTFNEPGAWSIYSNYLFKTGYHPDRLERRNVSTWEAIVDMVDPDLMRRREDGFTVDEAALQEFLAYESKPSILTRAAAALSLSRTQLEA